MRFWALSIMLMILVSVERSRAQTVAPSAVVAQQTQPDRSDKSTTDSSTTDSSTTDSSTTDSSTTDSSTTDSSTTVTRRLNPRKTETPFLPAGEDPENQLSTRLMRHLAYDQKQFWTAPWRLDREDAKFLLPFAAFTGTLVAGDAWISRQVPGTLAAVNRSKRVSDDATYSLIGAAGASYLWGHFIHDDHLRETGFLAGEAALDSTAVAYLFKAMTERPRPLDGNGNGTFFAGGASFPSEHSAIAWSIASVVAHEYPGTLTRIAAYALASGVTLTRVAGKQHFSSDVVVGSTLGWYFARQIYRAHHDPELGGTGWGSFDEESGNPDTEGQVRAPEHMGSPYVPLDSWVYAAIERLEAMGYIHTAFEGAKPWARTECARLISEADDELQVSTGSAAEPEGHEEAQALLTALSEEFHREGELDMGGANRWAALPTVYTRVVSASGTVLTDGYHFGQTYAYDYGRPFRRGTNFISGFSTDFTAGLLFLHLSGEFQHAPSAPALSDAVRQVIAERDLIPLSPAQPFGAINQVAVMDSYAGFNLDGWQISFGRQSLSWGPGLGGSLILSDNAAPFYMLRIAQAQPLELPSFLGRLGPVRLESFMGREKDHPISGRPFIYGQKISLKPFRSLEFAYARTTTIGGTYDPLNPHTFLDSFLGRVDTQENSVPGDSHTSIDWTWNLPHLHDRFVLYGEMESDDDPIPLQNPTRAVLRPGIFIVRLPWLNKWDLHAEWTSSVCPGERQDHGRLNYWNADYRDGYTNNGNLVGNTVGREGKTIQAWSRYWISPQQTIDFTAKNSEVDTDFIPGGGKWQDYRITHEATLRAGIYFKSFFQFERIQYFPVLFAGQRRNATASLEIGFAPGLRH
jgi:membrane-associated phospholipid phosphatase